MIAVVEAYIHVRADREVRVNPESAFFRFDLLTKAYNCAMTWFQDNNGSIQFIGK